MKAVLWDLDGTLVDSAADLAAAIDRMLVGSGRPPLGEARVRGFVGDGARKLVDRCVAATGSAPLPDDLERFYAEYSAALVVRTTVYAGIRALLTSVAGPQAVVTNKPERFARTILERLDLGGHFGAVVGGDSLPVRKPDPAPLRAALATLGASDGVLVGDGPADVGAARAAGLWMIGVSWGIARPEGANVHVESVDALRDALRDAGIDLR